ncbi:NAD(P)H-hydrate epimerase, partial [bacterium]|nr:NAD(P)H-hydrate epimerase [bacterium]
MKVANVNQMYEIDKMATEKYFMPSIILMENAGIKSIESLHQLFPDLKFKKVAVFVGPGNNGGDGLVIARHLFNQDISVEVFLMMDEEKAKGIAETNLKIVKSLKIPIRKANSIENFQKEKDELFSFDLIIDAILGIGGKERLS